MVLDGKEPIYLTLASYFRRLISRGFLKPGDALPSVREVALAERVNPNTVVRAYGLLVQEGLIMTLPKKGYYVSEGPRHQPEDEAKRSLGALLQSGYTKEQLIQILEQWKEEERS